MLHLTGQVVRVVEKDEKDFKTGEISKVSVVTIQHTSNDNPSSDLLLDNIKLKEPAQVAAFTKAVGQTMRVPVRTWAKGDKDGFWLEKGVLPTVSQAQPLKAAA